MSVHILIPSRGQSNTALRKDPRFLENVAEGTGDPGSEQLRFAVERLTEDFVNKGLSYIALDRLICLFFYFQRLLES